MTSSDRVCNRHVHEADILLAPKFIKVRPFRYSETLLSRAY